MIELWCRIEPLFLTGFVTAIVFVPITVWLDKRDHVVLALSAFALAMLPWTAGGAIVIVWFFSNLMIWIWR
jgi:hypothetical protein